jgi:fucose permease
MQPLVTFPASYILDQVGLKAGMNIGCIFMVIGYGLRLLINVQFWIFILGTYITGLGFVFVLNSPTKFASTWFPINQVTNN